MVTLNKKSNKEFKKKSDMIFEKTEKAFVKLSNEYGVDIDIIQTIKYKNKWKRLTVTH